MENNSQNQVINIRELIIKYAKKWYVFLIAIVLCGACGVLHILRTVPMFKTYSTILIRDKNANPMAGFLENSEMADVLAPSKNVDNEAEILKSKTITQQMVEELGLQVATYKKSGLRYKEQYGNLDVAIVYPEGFYGDLNYKFTTYLTQKSDGTYKISFEMKNKFLGSEVEKVTVSSLAEAVPTRWGNFNFIVNTTDTLPYKMKFVTYPLPVWVEIYGQQIHVDPISRKVDAISISIIGENHQKCRDIVNKIVELFNRDAFADKNRMATQMAAFISERLDVIVKELAEVETSVESYKKEHNLADISTQSHLFIQSASQYEKRIAEVEMQMGLVSFVENYVKDQSNNETLIPGNTGISDGGLTSLIASYNAQLLEYLRIKRSTNADNPIVELQNDQLQLARENIAKTIQNVKSSLDITRNDLVAQQQQFSSKIGDVPTMERQYVEIARQQQVKQSLYLFLLQKREETELNLASSTNIAKIIDPAFTELTAVKPRIMVTLFFAVILGFILAYGYLLVYEIFNNKITCKKDLQALTNLPILGQIPQHKNNGYIVMENGVQNVVTEMFRMVRSNIKFVLKKRDDKIILITSSVSGEGKSFVSTNLALSLAMINKKVVLIGLDIRKPMLSKYLNIESQYGITNYLVDETISIDEIINKCVQNDNLDVIVSGSIPPNPAEILNNNRLDELFAQLRTTYDYILVDTAPIGLVSDTFVIDRVADATLYVCRKGVTPNDQIEALNDLVAEEKLKNVSLILNGVNGESLSRYGYGTYIKK